MLHSNRLININVKYKVLEDVGVIDIVYKGIKNIC